MALTGEQLGRYKLLSVLGSGGMGEVYLAEDAHIHRQVAVKVVRGEASPYPNNEAAKESERLFRREVRAIATLDHPYVLPLFDYGEETVHGVVYTYMVMPLRQEGSLATWLRLRTESALLPPQTVVHFTSQAASALGYAHRRQIIHQDVKPSNFLIRGDEERPDLPDILLADFGIAKFYTATASLSQSSRGTPTYMAPEQWSGQPVPATDQYALAVMAYQLLTGDPPFVGRQEQMMYQHFHVQPKPASASNPAIPGEVDAVLLRALAKKPEERYPSISSFARSLRDVLQQSADAPTSEQRPRATFSALRTPSSALQSGVQPSILRATLAISESEASSGATRTLTLPGGRKVQVNVPPNVASGHTIYIEHTGSHGDGSPGEPLLVTIDVKRSAEERAALVHTATQADATHLSDPRMRLDALPVAPVKARRGVGRLFWPLSIGKVVLWIALVALIILASVGLPFYFTSYNYLQRASLLGASAPDPYHVPEGQLVLNDPLINNSNGYFWFEGLGKFRGTCNFIGAAYHVNPIQNETSICGPDSTYSNFTFEVQMKIIKGDCGGIAFRIDSVHNQFYYFRLCHDGSYAAGSNSDLLFDSAQKNVQPLSVDTSRLVTLAVVAQNSDLKMFINAQNVVSVQDSSYASGHIGVYASSPSQPTEVAFNNARVWTF